MPVCVCVSVAQNIHECVEKTKTQCNGCFSSSREWETRKWTMTWNSTRNLISLPVNQSGTTLGKPAIRLVLMHTLLICIQDVLYVCVCVFVFALIASCNIILAFERPYSTTLYYMSLCMYDARARALALTTSIYVIEQNVCVDDETQSFMHTACIAFRTVL